MSFVIKAARITNLKAIREVDLSDLGSFVLIGGANGAGKSGLIGILAGLTGHPWPDDLLRDGAKKGEGYCDLVDGDEVFRVRVTVKPNRPPKVTIMQIVQVSGEERELPIKGARGWLKARLGGNSMDVLLDIDNFNKPAGERAVLEQMRQGAGLDFTDLDKEDAELREQRKLDKHVLTAAAAKRDAVPKDADCPEPIVVADLVAERDKLKDENDARDHAESDAKRALDTARLSVQAKQSAIDQLTEALGVAHTELSIATREGANALAAHGAAAEATRHGLAPLIEQIASAEAVNIRVRQQAARKEHHATVIALDDKMCAATERLEAIAERKRAMLSTADFGVDGLTLSDDLQTILYEGEPLRRLSDGNKFAVFAMLHAAQNPDIGVMFSTRASLLDPEHLTFCHETAETMGMQLIFEVVGEREGAIVIEAAEGGSVVKGASDDG